MRKGPPRRSIFLARFAHRDHHRSSRTYGSPRLAGAPSRRRAPLAETSASTTTVITYGSVFVQSSVGPSLIPRAWSCGESAWRAPKKYAPTRQSDGRQNAKMTSAIAIHPAPPVIPDTHWGVIASVNVAPATPAKAPPTSVCAYRYPVTLIPIASAAAGD